MKIDLIVRRSLFCGYRVICADIVKQNIAVIIITQLSQLEDDKSQSISFNVTESLVIKCILTCITTAQAFKCYYTAL